MKKIIALLLGLIMVFSLAACANQEPAESTSGSQSETSENSGDTTENNQADNIISEPNSETPSEDKTTGGKTLVVYYSASGNTKNIAEYIAAATNADTFELIPVEPYSSADLDWTDRNSRVSKEHDDPNSRVVPLTASTVKNWDAYDTIFIGYPIWWGIAAWPVGEFISDNDFTYKTVIPFCTSSTSGLGESGQLLADAAGAGNWLTGERFQSRASEETVRAWVENLGL